MNVIASLLFTRSVFHFHFHFVSRLLRFHIHRPRLAVLGA